MAARDTFDSESRAAPQAVDGDRFLGIVGTRRLEATARAKKWDQGGPVARAAVRAMPTARAATCSRACDDGHRPLRGPSRRASSRSSAATSAVAASGADARATTTRSRSGGESRGDLAESLPHHALDSIPGHGVSNLSGDSDTKPGFSRQRRYLPQVAGGRRTGNVCRPPVGRHSAPPGTRAVCAGAVGPSRRSPRHAPRVTTGAGLLLGDADGELLAPLAPTPAQNFPAGCGLHPLAETVGALAALAMGLKRPLHD